MQGNSKINAMLNSLLSGELSAADQYFIHSRMYENWGFFKLFERLEHEREEELLHAARLIRRILFLGGTPDMATRDSLKIGTTVPEMIQSDLDYELRVVKRLRDSIALCEQEKDYETRRILVELLSETEEDHTRWLEVQKNLISSLGLENYLQSVAGSPTHRPRDGEK